MTADGGAADQPDESVPDRHAGHGRRHVRRHAWSTCASTPRRARSAWSSTSRSTSTSRTCSRRSSCRWTAKTWPRRRSTSAARCRPSAASCCTSATGADAESGYNSSLKIAGGLEMTTSKDVLEALANGAGPKKVLVTLGYSGWGAGQLEDEIADNSWITVERRARRHLRHAGRPSATTRRCRCSASTPACSARRRGTHERSRPGAPLPPSTSFLAFDFGTAAGRRRRAATR